MTTEMSRRELFDLVWTKPVTKVAADLGVSDVAVHKICVKHRIPVPGRGYWAKRAAGMSAKIPRYTELKDSAVNRIVVHGSTLAEMPPEVIAARQKARELAQARRGQQHTNGAAQVSDPIELHEVAARTKAKFEKAKPRADGFVRVSGRNVFAAAVTPVLADRVVLLVHRLSTEAESRGYRIASGEKSLHVRSEGPRSRNPGSGGSAGAQCSDESERLQSAAAHA